MNPVTGLSLGRIGVGVAALVKPDLVHKVFALEHDPVPSPTGATGSTGPTMLTQWFGSREIALGAATLLTAATGGHKSMVLLGMAVDAADAATAYQATERQELPRTVGLAATGVAAGAVLSGLFGLLFRGGRAAKKTAAKAQKKLESSGS